ncbi:hypothetical protein AB0N31_31710 [Streptomyces sp. NPDC051051]|uniref:hypothetical protein n=1 Tax=Streptomyces sp. NPDC051051 TaxID=3155666 RepID=UPI003438F308
MTGVPFQEGAVWLATGVRGRAVTLVRNVTNKEKSVICVEGVKADAVSLHPFGGKTPGDVTR